MNEGEASSTFISPVHIVYSEQRRYMYCVSWTNMVQEAVLIACMVTNNRLVEILYSERTDVFIAYVVSKYTYDRGNS